MKIFEFIRRVSFSLSLSLLWTGCSSSGPEAAPEPPAPVPAATPAAAVPATPPSVAEPATGGITAPVPEGWNRVAGSVLQVQYMKGTNSFIAKTEPFTGDDLDAIVAQATAMFQKTFTNVQVSGPSEKLTVDGKDARRLVFTCEISGMKMKYVYVYLKVGTATWAITFGGLVDTFDTLAADHQTILNGIRFQ